jgi:hypothetical protein
MRFSVSLTLYSALLSESSSSATALNLGQVIGIIIGVVLVVGLTKLTIYYYVANQKSKINNDDLHLTLIETPSYRPKDDLMS